MSPGHAFKRTVVKAANTLTVKWPTGPRAPLTLITVIYLCAERADCYRMNQGYIREFGICYVGWGADGCYSKYTVGTANSHVGWIVLSYNIRGGSACTAAARQPQRTGASLLL